MSRELDFLIAEKVMQQRIYRFSAQDYELLHVPEHAMLVDENDILCGQIPLYSRNMTDAWKVVERMVRIPETQEDARVARNTKFAYWFEQANLWSDTEADAATAICENALRIQADTSNPFDNR